MKYCPKCKTNKPIESWHRHGSRGDGLQGWCKICKSAQNKAWWLRIQYGIAKEEFYTMLSKQDGRCAICITKLEMDNGGNLACVDHDHDTGEVRMLLCDSCNKGIGFFKDDPSLLESAAAYLQEYQ